MLPVIPVLRRWTQKIENKTKQKQKQKHHSRLRRDNSVVKSIVCSSRVQFPAVTWWVVHSHLYLQSLGSWCFLLMGKHSGRQNIHKHKYTKKSLKKNYSEYEVSWTMWNLVKKEKKKKTKKQKTKNDLKQLIVNTGDIKALTPEDRTVPFPLVFSWGLKG